MPTSSSLQAFTPSQFQEFDLPQYEPPPQDFQDITGGERGFIKASLALGRAMPKQASFFDSLAAVAFTPPSLLPPPE